MSCLTCDGAGEIDAPCPHPDVKIEGWILTGEKPTACPVCRGPYVRNLVSRADANDHIVTCSSDACDDEVTFGSLVYAQLQSSLPPNLDEAFLICCDKHGALMAETFRVSGHPTVCLPFCIDDARDDT